MTAPGCMTSFDKLDGELLPAFERTTVLTKGGAIRTLVGGSGPPFDWNDENGPATELQARLASFDLIDTVATVRLELDNWTGHRFTDLFTLLKVDGEWKIMNKVFHLHL